MPDHALISIRNETYEVPAGQNLGQALETLNIPPELVLAIRSGEYMDAGAELHPGDQIKLVKVFAGG